MGTETYQKQGRKKETKMVGIHWKVNENNGTKQRLLEKAKRVKQKLQMTPGGDKTISRMSEKQMKKKLNGSIDTDETNQVRQWFWWPVERQQLNDMALQVITGNWVLKLLRSDNVLNDMQNKFSWNLLDIHNVLSLDSHPYSLFINKHPLISVTITQ